MRHPSRREVVQPPTLFLLQAGSRKCLGVSIGSCSPWSAAARVPQPLSIHPILSHPIPSIPSNPPPINLAVGVFSSTSNQQSIPILTAYQPVFFLLLHRAALLLIELDCLAVSSTDITSVARSFPPPRLGQPPTPPTNQTDSSVKPIAFLADLLFRHHRF